MRPVASIGLVVSTALVALIAQAPARATCTVPAGSDVGNVDRDCGCNGTDTVDDTACWQDALNTAKRADLHMGTVVASGTGVYYISNTLVLSSVFGGTVDAKGAQFWWTGPTNIPMWRLEDT